MYDHIGRVQKTSTRERILANGLRVIHEHGFSGASVRDIVRAAGVPQGSFTNHFGSKEAFGLEVINLYFAANRNMIGATLLNDALPPLARLGAYIDAGTNRLNQDNMRNGCLFGNFTAESGEHGEAIRNRLAEIFAEIRDAIATCLKAAVTEGELPNAFDCTEVAAFIVSSLQGANLLAKIHRNPEPVERFKRLLFSLVLR